MKQTITKGIVLARTNYQEADRILTILTPDLGKVRVLARGVRKSKSKLAGGIELFGVNEIGLIQGRGELLTLTSSRLIKHYDQIVRDIERTMLGYELLKRLNKATEENLEPAYFDFLQSTLEALNDPDLSSDLVRLWFTLDLLVISGHSPNLETDAAKQSFQPKGNYNFDTDSMAFTASNSGRYQSDHIKLLRLCIRIDKPTKLKQIKGLEPLTQDCLKLSQIMSHRFFQR